MKKLVVVWLVLLACLVSAGAAASGVDIGQTGGESLLGAVPEERRGYLDGIQPETADELAGSLARLLDNVSEDSRSALQNAASVAATVLTTESLVADIPEKNPVPAPAADPGMGGMY